MQRENERTRMTATGRRTDDGAQCTLLAVCETGGAWALYPHGMDKFGIRLSAQEARRVAQAIMAGGAGHPDANDPAPI